MTQKKVFLITGVVLILSLLAEALFVEPHANYWWHNMLGFDIIFGFLGVGVTIIISKALGKLFIQRKEGYYGGEDNHD